MSTCSAICGATFHPEYSRKRAINDIDVAGWAFGTQFSVRALDFDAFFACHVLEVPRRPSSSSPYNQQRSAQPTNDWIGSFILKPVNCCHNNNNKNNMHDNKWRVVHARLGLVDLVLVRVRVCVWSITIRVTLDHSFESQFTFLDVCVCVWAQSPPHIIATCHNTHILTHKHTHTILAHRSLSVDKDKWCASVFKTHTRSADKLKV